MTPLPKRGFGPPPRTVRFPPPSGVNALFFLYKNPRQSRTEALLEGSQNFRESAFSGTFSPPPYVLHPPISRPKRIKAVRGTAAINKKNTKRLELSISKNTPHQRCGEGPGSVDPRFAAGLPFPVPEILEFVASRDSGKTFQQFSRDFPGVFLGNPRTHPTNSHSLLEFSEKASTNSKGPLCPLQGHQFPIMPYEAYVPSTGGPLSIV